MGLTHLLPRLLRKDASAPLVPYLVGQFPTLVPCRHSGAIKEWLAFQGSILALARTELSALAVALIRWELLVALLADKRDHGELLIGSSSFYHVALWNTTPAVQLDLLARLEGIGILAAA